MVTPEQLFAEARRLQVSATTELHYRAVIERAYYAAYHAADTFEKSLPARSTHKRSGVGDHEALFLALQHTNPALEYVLEVISRDIAVQLRILRPFRKLATYAIHEAVTITDVDETMAAVTDVMKECASGQRRVAQIKREAAA